MDQASRAAAVIFGGVNPILRVQNLHESLEFYLQALGFQLDWQDASGIASVSRGRVGIFLCEGDQGNAGSWLWIGVSDIEPLFEDFRYRGAKIRHPPTNYSWAFEMQVEDPDGNVLRFGSEPKKGLPFGDWLDMDGNRWRQAADGKWRRMELD